MGSDEGRGWQRKAEGLDLDLYVFKAEDGSQRRMVINNAGWPTWADEDTVYFHRKAEDGWWSIFKVNVSDTSGDQGGISSIASDSPLSLKLFLQTLQSTLYKC